MKLFTSENTKVPYRIINFTSVAECPAKHLCQHVKQCYARKAEYLYDEVIPFRMNQTRFWDNASLEDIYTLANDLILSQKNARTYWRKKKVLRFSEAGDFKSQKIVNKFFLLADILIKEGWKIYGYSCRTDLDFSALIDIGVKINFQKMTRYYLEGRANWFEAVNEVTNNNSCKGNCRSCSKCLKQTGQHIQIKYH